MECYIWHLMSIRDEHSDFVVLFKQLFSDDSKLAHSELSLIANRLQESIEQLSNLRSSY
jgi:hypothetical protein